MPAAFWILELRRELVRPRGRVGREKSLVRGLHEHRGGGAPPDVALGPAAFRANAGVNVLRAHVEHLDVHLRVGGLEEGFIVAQHLRPVGAVDHDDMGGGATGDQETDEPEGMFHSRDFL